jgi:glycosyltransferase involved in cell wall biosynthesis
MNEIRDLKPDIIQLHCVHGYYINYEVLFEFLHELDVPVVWTFHDCWAFTGHCAHFDFAGCDKWRTGCHSCELLRDYPKSLFIDNSRYNWLRKKNCFTSVGKLHIVAVSNWLATLTRLSFMQKYPIEVIHNGIDISVFKPTQNNVRQRYNIPENDILILGVATSWGKEKGLFDFIKLSKEPGIKVILVGVPENVKKTLPENLIAVCRTESQRELAEFYSAADIFVNPTYNDSFPTVNLEALACGTPVLTYRTGGSPESITDETGVVVDRGDYAGLLSNVRMFAQVSFKSHHTAACRRHAEESFDKNKQFDEYRKLYERLLV